MRNHSSILMGVIILPIIAGCVSRVSLATPTLSLSSDTPVPTQVATFADAAELTIAADPDPPNTVSPEPPTNTPFPTPYWGPRAVGRIILDSQDAIACSYNLLLQMGLDPGFSYDHANYVRLHFPGGGEGALVTIGFSGVARGYRFLYILEENQFASVELALDSGINWGLRSYNDGTVADIEFVELLSDINGQAKLTLKLTGAMHQGTGLSSDGCFYIIDVTDIHMRVLFRGCETNIAVAGARGQYIGHRYEFIDLNDDGNREIVEYGEECVYQWSESQEDWEKTLCENMPQRVYWYDGIQYTEGDYSN